MVAPPTAAKANTVVRDEAAAAKAEKDAITEKEKAAALAARTKDGSSAVPAGAPTPKPPAAVTPVQLVSSIDFVIGSSEDGQCRREQS